MHRLNYIMVEVKEGYVNVKNTIKKQYVHMIIILNVCKIKTKKQELG